MLNVDYYDYFVVIKKSRIKVKSCAKIFKKNLLERGVGWSGGTLNAKLPGNIYCGFSKVCAFATPGRTAQR